MTIYGRQFARLRAVVIDRRHATVHRSLDDDTAVWNHPAQSTDEFYSLSPGFFVMSNCASDDYRPPSADAFNHGNYLNHWITATRIEHTVIHPESD